ncbi:MULTISPECIES: DUF429 domain-containing protein [unclassified Sinorhizobium]|uniref:DUF429 domain-containing protein n=1 Tax=unclassified Sinorhizobium TaxID=2613772 RepID=UPI0024C41DA5|nr:MULTISPECIES: DUF429 domain-containing protein [unclassified Sinorhizobium]MDK1377223.1 DUF429 domain-containing protein [Sinorhizobium sp. 6-70]MDK1478811.1 DUF429 domain-containing protein [Sinorhizobium sp. 6-117]
MKDKSFDKLLGIDVGYSLSRPTTGIAWCAGGNVGCAKAHTDWNRRQLHIPASTMFSVIAIDGPLLPVDAPDGLDRSCERLFIRGAFHARCKPGLSHHGHGLALRKAAAETAAQVRHLAAAPMIGRSIIPGAAIIEAFPNAFLGVLLEDDRFAMSRAAKRRRFDWLYDQAVESHVFDRLLDAIGWNNDTLLQKVTTERDHEQRAAWICLLTAATAVAGKSEAVGDEAGGWFWLPPAELWAPWARQALAQNSAAVSAKARAPSPTRV